MRGVGAVLMVAIVTGSPAVPGERTPPERLDAAVLGGLAAEEAPEDTRVLAIDVELPTVFLSELPPGMLELRMGLFVAPERSVMASLPSCVAVPSRSSCTKYGPHLRAMILELIGMRSPETQRISMSASSRMPSVFSPSSSDARECTRPPAVEPALRATLSPGPA